MKELYQKLLKFFNISGRDWAVLLLALLLAFSIWLIHNLSLRYNDYLDVSVIAHSNIEGHSDVSSNKCDVRARCRTTGYNVLRFGLRSRKSTVNVEFPSSIFKHREDDIFYLSSSDLQEYSHIIYGDDVTVEYFVSDTLFFRFPSMEYRKVPVHPVTYVTYQPQYINDGLMSIKPDTVVIYGEKFLLDNVERVNTYPIKHYDINSNVQGNVKLERIQGVRIAPSSVSYSMDVTRYVEIRRSLPVKVVDQPAGKRVHVYPATVDVALKCRFPMLSDPVESLEAIADFESYRRSLSGTCPIELDNLSKEVISYDISPVAVEFVVEDIRE